MNFPLHPEFSQSPIDLSSSTIRPATGSAIEILKQDEGMAITITTSRLKITSLTRADLAEEAQLWGDPVVMEKFATGVTQNLEYLEKRYDKSWGPRFKDHNPFSAYCVRLHDGTFIGHLGTGANDDVAGSVEIAYLFKKEFWSQGYAGEAAQALVKDLFPSLAVYGFKVNDNNFTLVEATARPDNPGSGAILKNLGIPVVSQEVKFEALRNVHRGPVSLETLHTGWEILSLPGVTRFVE